MRRTRFVIGTGALAAAGIVAGWAGPAGAGLEVQPDLSVKPPGGSFVGDDLYNESGAGQEVSGDADFGETATFRVRVQNDGDIASIFRLRGTPSAPGTRMRYFVAGQDVSRTMKHDGALTRPIPPDERIVVRVKATATDEENDSDTFFVRGDAVFPSADAFDVVLIEVRANPT